MAAAFNGGVLPTEIIYFPGDGVSLTVAARKKVSQAVAAFKDEFSPSDAGASIPAAAEADTIDRATLQASPAGSAAAEAPEA
mgnify:CR=1 FL=1